MWFAIWRHLYNKTKTRINLSKLMVKNRFLARAASELEEFCMCSKAENWHQIIKMCMGKSTTKSCRELVHRSKDAPLKVVWDLVLTFRENHGQKIKNFYFEWCQLVFRALTSKVRREIIRHVLNEIIMAYF